MILLLIGNCACKARDPEDIFITAQKALNNLKSYSATIRYVVIDGEDRREYRFQQWVLMPDCFKIQLIEPDSMVGKVIISDGEEILIEQPKIGDSLRFEVKTLSQERPLFIGDFLSSYWLSEEVEKKIRISDDGREYVILACPYREKGIGDGTQKLWLHR